MAKLAVAAAIVVGVCTSSGGGSPARHSRGKSFGLTATSSASYIDLRRDYAQTRASRSRPPKPVRPAAVLRPPTRTYASIGQINAMSNVDAILLCIHVHEAIDWHNRDTGHNGHWGGLQFGIPTWLSVGGIGNPADASPEEQMNRGRILHARSGWGQWSTHRLCGV